MSEEKFERYFEEAIEQGMDEAEAYDYAVLCIEDTPEPDGPCVHGHTSGRVKAGLNSAGKPQRKCKTCVSLASAKRRARAHFKGKDG